MKENKSCEADYQRLTVERFFDSLGNSIVDGMEGGSDIGEELLGIPGIVIGTLVGGVFGTVRGVVGTLLGERLLV